MHKFPPLTEQAKNLSESLGRLADAVIHGRSVMVTDEVYGARMALCNECKLLHEGRCVMCGCRMEYKARFATEACRVGKWNAETYK